MPERSSSTPDSEILLYTAENWATRVDVRLRGETVGLTQAQLVQLFSSSKQNISDLHPERIRRGRAEARVKCPDISDSPH
ncbi:hypothetical protein GCM10028800_04890 [Nesterenkonia populi]